MINRRSFVGSLAASAVAGNSAEAWLSETTQQKASTPNIRDKLSGPRPVPSQIQGVRHSVIDLSGTWQFSDVSPSGFRRRDLDALSWKPALMPNELAMLGFPIKQDVDYFLRRSFVLPLEVAGKAVVIRFDGVYSYGRVWVNGHYVRDHHGGFTSWDCEITQYVGPGERVDLVIGLVDRSDDPSGASEYAQHNIAGILRDVRVLIMPMIHIEHLQISSSLDDQYRTGLLNLDVYSSGSHALELNDISFSLHDPLGNKLNISAGEPLRIENGFRFEQMRIPNVRRWDSEHPRLYELVVEMRSESDLEIVRRQIGFRRIERVGNALCVNGERVVLRGTCRHDIHPTRGRASLLSNDEGDPQLLKKANINFVRTSHYPPSEAFLAACDRVGIYVEEETAVAFATGASSDPTLTDRFLGQFSEMLCRDHWHPSVILWSLGNESDWGSNFAEELRFARRKDPTRAVIFSWSDTKGMDADSLDVYSSHYPLFDGDVGSDDLPILHDEFAHVSCYNHADLLLDPGVRNFWGHSIAIFSKKFLETPGCLGGAIWAGIDEVFLLPNRTVGFGPWGILDGWRREKPEFWLTRKAFSPIRLEDGVVPVIQDGTEQVLTIGNAYNHTNLSEITIEWMAGDRGGSVQGPDVPPHGEAQFRIPVSGLAKGEVLKLRFRSPDGSEVDGFDLPVGDRFTPKFPSEERPLSLKSKDDILLISGSNFVLTFDKANAQIRNCSSNGRSIIQGGPLLNIGKGRPRAWLPGEVVVRESPGSIIVLASGKGVYDESRFDVQFELEIHGDGRLDLRYRLGRKWGGKINKLGMSFVLPSTVDRLLWRRNAQWSVYPDDHIGRPFGMALRTPSRAVQHPRSGPNWPWSEDTHDPFLDQILATGVKASNDFRSLKENVFWAACVQGGFTEHLRVESQGDVAVSAAPNSSGQVDFDIYNFWSYPDLAWGNYVGRKLATEEEEKTRPALPPEYKISLRIADILSLDEVTAAHSMARNAHDTTLRGGTP